MFHLPSLGLVPVLSGLVRAELDALSELATERTWERGDRLITRGTPVSHFYIIKDGRFALTTVLQAGTTRIETAIETKSDREALGWSALLPLRESIYSVYCVIPGTVIELPRGDLEAFMEANPRLGYRLMRNVTQLVGDRAIVLENIWRAEVEQDIERVKHWIQWDSRY